MSGIHPQAAALVERAAQSTRPNAHLLPVAEARRHFDAEATAAEAGQPVESVTELTLAVDGGAISARMYRPAMGELPIVVYCHGGGWVLGSVDSHDAGCRALANASGMAVVSVDYRRAPEHRFPTAVEDADAAIRWLSENGARLGLDPTRIAVAGDSAGANLAAAVTLLARDRGRPMLSFQLLFYPVTTTDLVRGFDAAHEGIVLQRAELQWHQDNYLSTPDDRRSPLVSMLDHAELRGLPPALVITAGYDPLHPQGELYAEALRDAGVDVEHLHYPGMIHGFFQMPATLDDAADAMRRAGARLRACNRPV